MHHLDVILDRQHGATEHALKLPGGHRLVRRLAAVVLAGLRGLGQGHAPAPQDFQLVFPDRDRQGNESKASESEV